MNRIIAVLIAFPLLMHAQTPVPPPAHQRTSIMFVVGCLAEENGKWFLNNAGEAFAVAGLPGSKTDNDPKADAPLGKNRFSLIGNVEEFGPGKHKGQKVRVKGLLIKAQPVSRVNITSLKMLAAECK
jgi:hypothetical protein